MAARVAKQVHPGRLADATSAALVESAVNFPWHELCANKSLNLYRGELLKMLDMLNIF